MYVWSKLAALAFSCESFQTCVTIYESAGTNGGTDGAKATASRTEGSRRRICKLLKNEDLLGRIGFGTAENALRTGISRSKLALGIQNTEEATAGPSTGSELVSRWIPAECSLDVRWIFPGCSLDVR